MTALSAKLLLAAVIAAACIAGCELWERWQRRRLTRRARARVCFACSQIIETGAEPAIRTLCSTCLEGRK